MRRHFVSSAPDEARGASCDIAIRLRPDAIEPYNNRGVALHELGRYEDALASHDQVLALKPDAVEVLRVAGHFATVRGFHDALLAGEVATAPSRSSLATSKTPQRSCAGEARATAPEAEGMFLRALELKPDFTDPIFSLTQIRRYRDKDDADAKRIRNLLDSPGISLHARDCLVLSLLEKIYDDRGSTMKLLNATRKQTSCAIPPSLTIS